MKSRELYVSVDVETSGPIPGKFSLLSIGAAVVGNLDENFYVELAPISERFIPEAMKVVGSDLDHFREKGVPPGRAMHKFEKWVNSLDTKEGPTFVGFNAVFDWSFINWYFHEFIGRNPFGIGGIDIKSYFMGMSGARFDETAASSLPPRFKGNLAHTHNALDDAKEQGEIFRKMLEERSKISMD